MAYICRRILINESELRGISSVGLEHLPYKQRFLNFKKLKTSRLKILLEILPEFFQILKRKKIFWGISSVGLEHLPYKQRVTGSNPVFPTKTKAFRKLKAFVFYKKLPDSIKTSRL